jgi:hypothetical protein
LLSGLLDHVFHCPDDFLIAAVEALALHRHHAGTVSESVQDIIDQCVHALCDAWSPGIAGHSRFCQCDLCDRHAEEHALNGHEHEVAERCLT